MTNRSHPTRCASIAIAATLALGSTSLLAQDVAAPPAGAAPPAPVIVLPEPQPAAPPPAPTIVIPEELIQPEPQAAAPQQPARTAPRPAAPRAAAAAPAPEPAPPAETAETAAAPAPEAVTLDTPVAVAPAPEPLAAAPEAPVASDETEPTSDNAMAAVLGILAALGLIVLGFFALRRRSSPKRYAKAAPIEKPVTPREPAPAPMAELPQGTGAPEFPAVAEPQPVADQANGNVAYSTAAFASAAAPSPASSLSHSGAAIALPRALPGTYEEREALIQRMVDAPPDRANPFRSRRARWHRARLIVQSLGRDFKDAEPWIDLSQYSSNWPELARRPSVAA